MAKAKIEIIASEETYTNLVTFNKVEELNKVVRMYKDQINEANVRVQKKRSALAILEWLKRHSCLYLGVSWKGKRKIAKDLNMSDKTVTRICLWLEGLGIIKQHEMKRASDMRQTSNAIVIQPLENKENETDILLESDKQTSKVSDQKNKTFLKQLHNIKHLNMSRETSKRKPYIKMVPKRLQQYQAFFGNQTKSLYGRIWLAMKNFGVSVDRTIMQDIAHIAFDKLVDYIKQGRNLSTEEMHKVAYTIAYNQLLERDDTKAMANFVDSFIERTKHLKNHPLHSGI
ncbi:hypothetical protein [Priestia aryabhattai]